MKNIDFKEKTKIEIEKIKKLFYQIDDPEPDRDWFAVFSVFFLIFLIISVWSTLLYFLYFPNESAIQAITTTYGSIDEKKLSSVISTYEERKIMVEELQKNPPVFIDPSI